MMYPWTLYYINISHTTGDYVLNNFKKQLISITTIYLILLLLKYNKKCYYL